MLERVGQEKAACEEEGRREKRRSDQLGESMTSLRMVNYISVTSNIVNLEFFSQFENCLNNLSFNLWNAKYLFRPTPRRRCKYLNIVITQILEEEQRKSEEKERKIQNFDRVIKETREMFDLKQSEVFNTCSTFETFKFSNS